MTRSVVATALFWFAFSLPFNGLFLLLTRTFFSLQRPWVPTAISGINLAITALAALALYAPFGVGGIVAATVIATAASVLAQTIVLRRQLGRLELGRLVWTTIRVSAAAAALAGASYGVWYVLDQALGRGLGAQIDLARGRPRRRRRWSTPRRSPCSGSPRRSRSGGCFAAASARHHVSGVPD